MAELKENIVQGIRELLESYQLQYHYDPETSFFSFEMTRNVHRLRRVQYQIFVGEADYEVLAQLPIAAIPGDEEMMARTAEYLARANYAVIHGCFDLDCETGDVCYKVEQYLAGLPAPTLDMVRMAMIYSLACIRKYGDGLVRVLYGMERPREAIFHAEEEDEEHMASVREEAQKEEPEPVPEEPAPEEPGRKILDELGDILEESGIYMDEDYDGIEEPSEEDDSPEQKRMQVLRRMMGELTDFVLAPAEEEGEEAEESEEGEETEEAEEEGDSDAADSGEEE